MRAVLILGTIVLASCSSLPSVQVPERVYVETPVPCVKPGRKPAAPQVLSDEELMALDSYRRTVRAYRDLTALRIYAVEAAAVIEGCSRIPERKTGGPP